MSNRMIDETEEMANGLYEVGAMKPQERLELSKDLKELRDKERIMRRHGIVEFNNGWKAVYQDGKWKYFRDTEFQFEINASKDVSDVWLWDRYYSMGIEQLKG